MLRTIRPQHILTYSFHHLYSPTCIIVSRYLYVGISYAKHRNLATYRGNENEPNNSFTLSVFVFVSPPPDIFLPGTQNASSSRVPLSRPAPPTPPRPARPAPPTPRRYRPQVQKEPTLCRKGDECMSDTYCDTETFECPAPAHLTDGTPCASGSRVCRGGRCVSSVCRHHGWDDCDCARNSTAACVRCCRRRRRGRADARDFRCRPAHLIDPNDRLAK